MIQSFSAIVLAPKQKSSPINNFKLFSVTKPQNVPSWINSIYCMQNRLAYFQCIYRTSGLQRPSVRGNFWNSSIISTAGLARGLKAPYSTQLYRLFRSWLGKKRICVTHWANMSCLPGRGTCLRFCIGKEKRKGWWGKAVALASQAWIIIPHKRVCLRCHQCLFFSLRTIFFQQRWW